MDIQSVLFVLRFVCGDYLPCYRNRCNLYFKLLHRFVLKKKLSFLAQKPPEISNRQFFFSCRHEHAWRFWQEVCSQVGGPCLLLFTTWVPKGQQTPKIRKFALCTMTKNWIVNLHVILRVLQKLIIRINWQRACSGLETLTTYDLDVFDADLNLVFTLNSNIHIRLFFSFQHVFKMKFIFMLHLPKNFQLKIYRTKQHGILNNLRVL